MTKVYTTFIGIDIGKFECVLALHGSKTIRTYANTTDGIINLYKDNQTLFKDAFVVLETTGGYESLTLSFLIHNGIAVHRANTRKVKSFIRSYGTLAKTDALDAAALALYGVERYKTLEIYQPNPHEQLRALSERRSDLVKICVQEKNRKQAPGGEFFADTFEATLSVLAEQIEKLDEKIKQIIAKNPCLQAKIEMLKSVDGIGDKVAQTLLSFMPEIGELNQKQAASLAGVAPHPNQSGTRSGYARTRGGRTQIRPILFIAAMAASRSKGALGQFYQRLVNNGKPKMVALVALMRKIIIIANARVKEVTIATT